jgi:polar amino acid transport system substrate-binding protein
MPEMGICRNRLPGLPALALLVFTMVSETVRAAETDAAALAELAPTGTLRVAIGVGPVPGPFYAIEDPASGEYRGVTVELAKALGESLGLPIVFLPYLASGEIQALADDGVWDVTFMPVDAVRKEIVAFGNAYHLLQSTYLVAEGSAIASVADANFEGMRIVGVADTATFRASNAASPRATHIAVAGPDDAVALMQAGGADAIALGRESLEGINDRLPGARILEDAFLNSSNAVAVPKGRPAALRIVSAFVEDAKSSGLLRRAFDAYGMENSVIAPPGMVP